MEDCNVRMQQQPVNFAVDQTQEKAAVLAHALYVIRKRA